MVVLGNLIAWLIQRFNEVILHMILILPLLLPLAGFPPVGLPTLVLLLGLLVPAFPVGLEDLPLPGFDFPLPGFGLAFFGDLLVVSWK